MTEKVLTQIWWLCQKINTVEWSGILFFKDKGDISDISKLDIELVEIYPMHKGSAGYTEYELGNKIIDIYDKHPELIGCKYGHVH